MKEDYAQEWPQFFTATIQEWKHLLKEDKYKNIIVDALKFLVKEDKVTINGFVIMSNHLYIIWQSKGINEMQKIQSSFMKHTSKEFKKQLEKEDKLLALVRGTRNNKIKRVSNKINFI